MRRALLLLFLLVFVAAVAAWQWWVPATGDGVSVRAVEVSRGNIETRLALTGTVVNDYTVQLTALLDGEITSIEAREGDTVDKAAVLATLDDQPPRALLDKAGAERALRGHELGLAVRRHDRVLRMSRVGDESTQALEDSLLEKQRAEAALDLARADYLLAELRLKNASVRAPFAGVVTRQAVETGQWVEAGTRLFTLVAEDGRVVEAEADAGDFSRLAVGQGVSLSLSESPEERWTSQIVRIAESVTTGDSAAGNTFTVRIGLGAEAPQLLLGQQLDVDVSTSRRTDVLRIPLEAVRESADGQVHVWVEEQGRARERAVTLGLRTINQAQVLEGLSAGESVLLSDTKSLSDGVAVSVQAAGERPQP
jgi:RND family efflux transporter MFP subunit